MDSDKICVHLAKVMHLLIKAVDENPLLLFDLQGLKLSAHIAKKYGYAHGVIPSFESLILMPSVSNHGQGGTIKLGIESFSHVMMDKSKIRSSVWQ